MLNPSPMLTRSATMKTLPERNPDPWVFASSTVRPVHMYEARNGTAPRVDFVYPAIQELVAASVECHFPEIKELVLDDDSYLLSLNQMLDMFAVPAPALEHLTLSTIEHRKELGPTEEFTIVKGFWKFLKKTPRLRSLKLFKCLLGPMPPATGLS
ncbi:hypothetical protein C8F04DRAFT_1082941, partial [Mycena alexandri]